MIKVCNLNYSYSDSEPLLKNISFNLKKGEILSIVGASGSGKTTLLKIIAGIINQFQGEVSITNREVGYIPQDYGLIPWKKVKDNIIIHRKLKYGRKNIDIDKMNKLCEELKIEDILNKYPKHISGGQKQRVAIARAFYLESKLLLMDEPFSALDMFNREEAKDFFMSIWQKHRITTILVTHDIKEAIYLGHKIGVITDNDNVTSLKIFDNKYVGKKYEEKVSEYSIFINEINKIITPAKYNKRIEV